MMTRACSPVLLLLLLGAHADEFCRDKAHNSLFAYPADCNKYYHCSYSNTYVQRCQVGLVFNPGLSLCDWPYNYRCTPETGGTDESKEVTPGIPTDAPPTPDPNRPAPTGPPCGKRVCYYTNWSQYRQGYKFRPENIDADLCTHIIYAFAKIVDNKLEAVEWNDMSTPWSAGMYEQVVDLKKNHPHLKVLLAVGGWSLSDTFSDMVSSKTTREVFISSSIGFLRDQGFDGLDIDWEYPGKTGQTDEKQKLVLLVQELKAAFLAESTTNTLLLSAAVPAGTTRISIGYDVASLGRELDFVNLMAYDLHGAWDSETGHNSPLYPGAGETGDAAKLNVQWTARHWASEGCPKEKIVVGIPLYGRQFRLSSRDDNGVGASIVGAGDRQPYTKDPATASYYEACNMLNQGGQYHWIDDQRVPYIVQGDQWLGYDNIRSVEEKVRHVRSEGYGGVMVWALDLDDFEGRFCNQGKYPLLRTINATCAA